MLGKWMLGVKEAARYVPTTWMHKHAYNGSALWAMFGWKRQSSLTAALPCCVHGQFVVKTMLANVSANAKSVQAPGVWAMKDVSTCCLCPKTNSSLLLASLFTTSSTGLINEGGTSRCTGELKPFPSPWSLSCSMWTATIDLGNKTKSPQAGRISKSVALSSHEPNHGL